MTGTAVKRLKKDVSLSIFGNILGFTVCPFSIAVIAITEHMTTNTIARRTANAELNHNDSAIKHRPHKQNVSNIIFTNLVEIHQEKVVFTDQYVDRGREEA